MNAPRITLRPLVVACTLLFASNSLYAHVHEGSAEGADVHTTTRVLSATCKRLTLISPVTVVLRQGPQATISLTGTDEDIARVEAVVEKDRVVIRNKGLLGRGPEHTVTAVVTLPALAELRVGQHGQLRTEGLITGTSLTVTLDGPANVDLMAALDGPLSTSVNGSGKLKLSGQCARHVADVTGTGQIDASQMEAADATASVMGQGDIHVDATATLQAIVNGPGRVRYSGSPVVTERVGGGGAVVKK